jgi:hypothetical protein
MLMAIAVGYEISPLSQQLIDGRATGASPLARGLLQKTLFFEHGAAPTPGVSSEDRRVIEQSRKPVLVYLAQAPKPIRPKLERGYADYLRFRVIIPKLSRLHGARDDWQVDPVLAKYALAQIEAFPLQYLSGVIVEDLRLLSFQDWNDRRTQDEFSTFVAAHPLPLPAAAPPTSIGVELDRRARAALRLPPTYALLSTPGEIFRSSHVLPVPLILALRLTHAVAALIGVVAVVATLWPGLAAKMAGGDYLRAVAALGLLLHSQTLLTSLSEFGLLRYIMPLWSIIPAIYVLSLLAIEKTRRPEGAAAEARFFRPPTACGGET